jgi:mannosylglucosylglycerate synthase
MSLSIAILHYAGPPTIGGVEATIAAHARVMAAHGHQVRIIAGRAGPLHPAVEVLVDPYLDSRGAEVEQVARELAAGQAGPAFESLTARIAERLAQALAGIEVAIVHNVLTLHKNLAFTAALHRLHSAGLAPRLLAWCHDMAWLDPLYTPALHHGYPWKLLHVAWPGVRYVVVSGDRREMLAELLGLPPDQIAAVTPGVDLAAFLKLERETLALIDQLDLLAADPLLLLPARITRRKNIEQAIAIVGALRRQGLRPRLIVTGPPGPHNPANAAYLAELQQLRRGEGAEDAVVFLYESYVDERGQPRPISDALLADLYKLADGLLFPSHYEGFGMPIVEAGLAGIPIFCSDLASFREAAGDAALRFAPDDPPVEVAANIAGALRVDARAAFRRRVRLEYTWESIYRRLIEPLLDEAIAS